MEGIKKWLAPASAADGDVKAPFGWKKFPKQVLTVKKYKKTNLSDAERKTLPKFMVSYIVCNITLLMMDENS